ncbi:MAG: sugar ABC transporter substrate-binding protein [Chloroflexales bacterium]|nr:sugar ABC transporter substrate-binding protein [Chloroflexales bacterium]
MRRLLRACAALFPTILMLAACGTAATPAPTARPEPDMVIIGYSAPGLVGAQLQIQQGLERRAKAQGWQLLTTTSDGDPQKQVEQIASYIKLGVDAIVAVPDDSKVICAAVEQARAAKIPFYTIDRSPEGCTINMTVLSDNYLAGKQSGQEMVNLLTTRYGEPKGTLLEITGNMAQNVAQLRGGGFQDVVKGYPNIKLITKQGDWDGEKGAAAVREALAAAPEIDGIYVHSDAVYFEAVMGALKDLGRLKARGEEGHIFLAGVDASPAGMKAIRDGFADQVSNQPIPDFGLVADWIAKELKGEAIAEGEVAQDGALWSPAMVKLSPTGPQLFLATTSVTEKNVDLPGLWANQ